MRIIYIHQYFATPSMPGGTRSYEFARRLVQNGHDVQIVTSQQSGASKGGWYTSNEDGIVVHWLPNSYSNRMSYSGRILAFLRFAVRSAFKARSLGGDVVFATSTPLTIALPGVFAARWSNVPFVFEVRDLWPEMPIALGALKSRIAIFLARRLEKFAYVNARHIIALSPGMKEGVLRLGIPDSKVTVITNSSDVDFFRDGGNIGLELPELKRFSGKKFVLYAGTLGVLNGVDYFAEIAAEYIKLDSDVVFVVAGDGAERRKIEERAMKLGVMDVNFAMIPAVPKIKMPALFHRAELSFSLFIDLKEMHVNSANKFFDGLASRTPVVINYEGWQADVLRENFAGFVVPPRNAAAAASAIFDALADSEKLRLMGENAGLLAENTYSRDAAAVGFERVLINAVA